MKKFIKILIVPVLMFGFVGQVFAHATPVSYEPEANSVVEAPSDVRIHFSERIEGKASDIRVFGPDGSNINSGVVELDPLDPRVLETKIKDGGTGTYTVSWEVASADDGHFTKGGFIFSVGKPTSGTVPVGQIQIQHITALPQAATIGIELAGQAMIIGVLFFLIFLWRPLKKKFHTEVGPYIKNIEKRFSTILISGAIFVIIGALLFIILKTFDLKLLRPGDFVTTLKIFISTVDGSHALLRSILGLLCIPLFMSARKSVFKSEKITKGEIAVIAFVFLMILSRARVSHAAASHFYPIFSICVNAVQLFFKELWVGGLVVFSLAFAPFLLHSKTYQPFAFVSTNFSKAISIAFAGVGVSGAYIVWLHLKSPAYLFSTAWGTCFIILSLVGGILFGIRLYHQTILDKFLASGRINRVVSLSTFTLLLEMMVGVALLFVTSLIIITTPPYATEHFTFNKTSVSQDVQISTSVHPFEPGQFLIAVTQIGKSTEVPVSNMIVKATNEEKNIGPIVLETEKRFEGGYVFPESDLTPEGLWRIDISAQRPGSYDAVSSFKLDYPKDIEASRIDPDKHHFGLFELSCVVAAILIFFAGLFLYNWSRKLHKSLKNNEKSPLLPLFSFKLSFFISLLALILICIGLRISYNIFIKTDFQKLCEKNGHFWSQSIPLKDGKAFSSDTVTGCMLDVGLYHFADKREYEFFFRKREVVPEISYTPAAPVAGAPTDIMISLNEIKDGQKAGPVTDLGINHDRILHVLVAGKDMKTYAHIHTEDLGPITEEMKKNASFPLRYTFPKGGRYALNIDYVVSGIEYTNVAIINVSGSPQMEKIPYIVPSDPINKTQTKEFDGYAVTFNEPKKIKAGEKVRLSYFIEKDGKPVTDLEPYLGAAMHIGIVRNDLGRFFHTHGEASAFGSVWFQQLMGKYFKYHMHFAPDEFGPKIISPAWTTKFTTPGVYTIFGEFKVGGKIIVTDFTAQVE